MQDSHNVLLTRRGGITWVTYERGIRNIWTAASPDFKPQKLTDYQTDDGQRISGLQFTTDGNILLFQKGNTEDANPTSDTTQPYIKIHLVNLVNGESRELVAGHGARISPDNATFIYIHEGKLLFSALAKKDPVETGGDDEMRSVVESRRVSLWVGNINDGSASMIWEPATDNGFFEQYYPDQSLSWAANGRIVFYSEHDGWVHIYAIDANGDKLADLTPGACEAEHSALSHDGKALYFSRNCSAGDELDIDRRHLWKNNTTGGRPVNLTAGSAIETNPVQPGNGNLLAL